MGEKKLRVTYFIWNPNGFCAGKPSRRLAPNPRLILRLNPPVKIRGRSPMIFLWISATNFQKHMLCEHSLRKHCNKVVGI